jgi:aminocarboxymuconate-semialdehyde decarboxylase
MQTLFKRVGADRMVLGSDYPVGGSDPVGEVKEAINLSDEDLHFVAGGRAAQLLGLKA